MKTLLLESSGGMEIPYDFFRLMKMEPNGEKQKDKLVNLLRQKKGKVYMTPAGLVYYEGVGLGTGMNANRVDKKDIGMVGSYFVDCLKNNKAPSKDDLVDTNGDQWVIDPSLPDIKGLIEQLYVKGKFDEYPRGEYYPGDRYDSVSKARSVYSRIVNKDGKGAYAIVKKARTSGGSVEEYGVVMPASEDDSFSKWLRWNPDVVIVPDENIDSSLYFFLSDYREERAKKKKAEEDEHYRNRYKRAERERQEDDGYDDDDTSWGVSNRNFY